MKDESLLFKVGFWAWLFSVPAFCFWWASFVSDGWGDSNGLWALLVVGGGCYAYLRVSFWLFDAIERLAKPKRKR